jgi:hypothetical protein
MVGRVARFFLVQNTKTGKYIPNDHKDTKWPENIPNGRYIDQMAINIPTSSIARPSKIDPNWDFWFQKCHLATLMVGRSRQVLFVKMKSANQNGKGGI